MSIRASTVKQKRKIATFISRAIVTVLGALTLTVLFQSYQISSRLISQEVARTSTQTSSLIQNLFNYRLATLQIHQDSSAKNASLIQALNSDSGAALDQYFLSVDQLELNNTPDIRFITDLKEMVWEDGNSQFYGVPPKELNKIIRKVSISSNWHLIQTPSVLGTAYLLVRRSPIVDTATGEVIGFLYVSTVLNNNFTLIETIRDSSNSQNLILTVGSEVLASTLNGDESYSTFDVLEDGLSDALYDKNMVAKTALEVEGVPTYLSIYSVQSNENALSLRNNYYFWMVFALVAMVGVSILTRWWLQRRIESEIDGLMTYTHKVAERGLDDFFPGSKIYEFDHFGRTLEHTFQRLSDQEKQFEDLFNFALSPTILWTAEGELIRMNPSAHSHFLRNNADDHSLFSVLKRQLIPQIKLAAQGEILKEVNTEVDGRVILWNLSPIVVENRIESIITQGQDVTSIAEAEKQSRIARKEAEESARVRADFLAKMSHELRTPLNGILGVSQLLKRTVTEKEQAEQVNVLCSSGEHLLAVLNDILDFSKIEQGKFRIQKADFPLVDVVSAIERIYRPLCREKGLTLTLNTNISDDLVVRTDQVRLNQILFNLLNNSVKFTHEGAINIQLHLIETDAGAKLEITVLDTGIGIREQDLALIFEPFVQAESTNTREYGGSGLGLAIVHSLIEMLGGSIEVKSSFGVGTRFTIELPLEIVTAETQTVAHNEGKSRYELFDGVVNVLLVEDNHTNAFIARAFCKKYGMNVDWVTDGLQAIEKVKHQPYDLILMDNQLPYLDGVDATRIIKHDMGLAMPVYACTADGMVETQEAFMSAGAEYVIVKPIKEETLHQALVNFKTHAAELAVTER
ncbi:quorum-sensing autoinducer 2 sensor kinase/phosphatase LuxQ [Vibrio furnissii]|uniref:quorum-sensing autoinducer 2 sensor kinase/phosphatase LuxQ n=1 Tax=Vibrio furnissii TaxID=29494 RepID=UPI003AA8AE89